MTRVTTKQVNAHAEQYGVQVVKGDGYFYLAQTDDFAAQHGDDVHPMYALPTTMIFVQKLSDMTLEQWQESIDQLAGRWGAGPYAEDIIEPESIEGEDGVLRIGNAPVSSKDLTSDPAGVIEIEQPIVEPEAEETEKPFVELNLLQLSQIVAHAERRIMRHRGDKYHRFEVDELHHNADTRFKVKVFEQHDGFEARDLFATLRFCIFTNKEANRYSDSPTQAQVSISTIANVNISTTDAKHELGDYAARLYDLYAIIKQVENVLVDFGIELS